MALGDTLFPAKTGIKKPVFPRKIMFFPRKTQDNQVGGYPPLYKPVSLVKNMLEYLFQREKRPFTIYKE